MWISYYSVCNIYICRTSATILMPSTNIWKFMQQCQILRYTCIERDRIYICVRQWCVALNCWRCLALQSDGGDRKDVPEYVINHGILNSTSLKKLLKASRVGASVWCLVLYTENMERVPVCSSWIPLNQVFIGLGFPPEGPAPLEAIAHGCVFLNPQLDPPVNRENTLYFIMRPTDREVKDCADTI